MQKVLSIQIVLNSSANMSLWLDFFWKAVKVGFSIQACDEVKSISNLLSRHGKVNSNTNLAQTGEMFLEREKIIGVFLESTCFAQRVGVPMTILIKASNFIKTVALSLLNKYRKKGGRPPLNLFFNPYLHNTLDELACFTISWYLDLLLGWGCCFCCRQNIKDIFVPSYNFKQLF